MQNSEILQTFGQQVCAPQRIPAPPLPHPHGRFFPGVLCRKNRKYYAPLRSNIYFARHSHVTQIYHLSSGVGSQARFQAAGNEPTLSAGRSRALGRGGRGGRGCSVGWEGRGGREDGEDGDNPFLFILKIPCSLTKPVSLPPIVQWASLVIHFQRTNQSR